MIGRPAQAVSGLSRGGICFFDHHRKTAQRQSCITGDRAMHFLLRTARRRPRPPFASAWGTNKATSIFPAAAPAAPAPAPAAATTTRKITSTRRRWSSSGFAAGDHAGAAAEMPSLPSAFPWREAPDKMNVRGLVERAMHSYLQHQHRRFLRAASRLNDADDETFLRAAEMAFVQVAAGAFQMPAHHVIAPLAGEESGRAESSASGGARDRRRERTPLWDVPEGVVVDPRDVMHKDLADFYMQAAVATKLSRCTPFYRLHGFGECKVSNINVLWGAQRGNLPEGGETIEIWGSKYVWESVLEDAQALLRHQLLNDSSKLDSHRLSSIRRTTLQVDVDIDCTETFFVSDDTTQEVLQGSKAVGVSKHRLRLECSPFFKRDFQWVVVDLDNWMKGNTFW